MTLRGALKIAGRAARANLLPGLLLQSFMLVFLGLYLTHEGTREFLVRVANLKEESGYAFAFVSYILAAALLPEILNVAFFQRGRMCAANIRNFLTAAPLWGLLGVATDFFYRCQIFWFGTASDWTTILPKMLVDQALYAPLFATPLCIIYFAWRDAGFRATAFTEIFHRQLISHRIFPVQVAGWCIWIPGVCLVYFMPDALQIPVAVIIQSFWVLVFMLARKP